MPKERLGVNKNKNVNNNKELIICNSTTNIHNNNDDHNTVVSISTNCATVSTITLQSIDNDNHMAINKGTTQKDESLQLRSIKSKLAHNSVYASSSLNLPLIQVKLF